MRIFALIAFLATSPLVVWATTIELTPIDRQVADADLIVVGQVTEVTLHGRFGWRIRDPEGRTGPGLPNELRLHVRVTRQLKGPPLKMQELVLPMWKMWHNSLKDASDVYAARTWIFFLNRDAKPANIAEFVHFEGELTDIEKILSQKPNPER